MRRPGCSRCPVSSMWRTAAAFRNEVFGATRERMSREFCDLVEALSVDRPWVLVIEDMHWSDFQTVDRPVALRTRRPPGSSARSCHLSCWRQHHERTSGSPSASGFGDPREVQRAATRSIVQNRGGAPPRLAFPGREACFGALRADVSRGPRGSRCSSPRLWTTWSITSRLWRSTVPGASDPEPPYPRMSCQKI